MSTKKLNKDLKVKVVGQKVEQHKFYRTNWKNAYFHVLVLRSNAVLIYYFSPQDTQIHSSNQNYLFVDFHRQHGLFL